MNAGSQLQSELVLSQFKEAMEAKESALGGSSGRNLHGNSLHAERSGGTGGVNAVALGSSSHSHSFSQLNVSQQQNTTAASSAIKALQERVKALERENSHLQETS